MTIILFIITKVSILSFVKGACNSKTGPAGSNDCFLAFPFYTKYQWGTCLSNAYIKQKSGGSHRCRDNTAIYCYYQCMVELHDIDEGPVYDNCACNSGVLTPSPKSTLPSSCYSPTGEDCSWYRNCLATKLPCTGSQTEYAISYGQKFCSLYDDRRYVFSPRAINWINAVRKCLQVSLVPLLRDYLTVSCDDIFDTAMASHPSCYLSPYQGFSVCNLSANDWWQIFWTVKSAFEDQFVATLSQSLDTAMGCANNVLLPVKNYLKTFLFRLILFSINLKKRSIGSYTSNNETAFRVLKIISQQLNWEKYSIDWYTYTTDSSFGNDEWNVMLLLADTNALGLTKKATNLNITDAINALSAAIQNGILQINLPGSPGLVFVGKSLGNCLHFVNGFCRANETLAALPDNFTPTTHTTLQPNFSSSVSYIIVNNLLVFFYWHYFYFSTFLPLM